MATITASTVTERVGDRRVLVTTWETMGNADSGTAVSFPQYPDKTVHVKGTFGSATVVLQGSNDNVTWITLSDPQGTALSFTTEGLSGVSENPLYVRASTSGGTGTDVDVIMVSSCRANQ